MAWEHLDDRGEAIETPCEAELSIDGPGAGVLWWVMLRQNAKQVARGNPLQDSIYQENARFLYHQNVALRSLYRADRCAAENNL